MAHIVLFPHTHIPAPDLQKILASFGELTICQPWFMEKSLLTTEKTDRAKIRVQHPPETLKPKGDFLKLINEYQLWLRQNPDKGYGAFLGATRDGSPSEDTPWEIRQLISNAGAEGFDPHGEHGFKWHLILHLAREFEENRFEAEKLLNNLKYQKSPLEGALEEAPPQRFFEHTPIMEAQLQVDDYHLRQVFEAWFGLFGEFLSDQASLITLDPQVLSYASELFEPEERIIRPKMGSEEGLSPETASGQTPHTERHLPRPADGEEALNDPVKKGLSGRTIILMEE